MFKIEVTAFQRFVIIGDTHGNRGWLIEFLKSQKKAHDIEVAFVVGDFGYWEHTASGIKFLEELSYWLKELGITLYFIRGNHENHEMLKSYNGESFTGDTPVEIRERLLWVPDACALELVETAGEGYLTALTLGGAYSIDQRSRLQGKDYWSDEIITESIFHQALDTELNEYNLLLSHDTSNYAFQGLINSSARNYGFLGEEMERACNIQRQYISEVIDAKRIRVNIHGHHHHGYGEIFNAHDRHEFVNIGLANDTTPYRECSVRLNDIEATMLLLGD